MFEVRVIRIVQCLCGPARHAILGIAYEPGNSTVPRLDRDGQATLGTLDYITLTEANAADYVREIVNGAIARKTLNPWCGICGAPEAQWRYEDARSKFKTIEEAQPELDRVQAENLRSRALIDEMKTRAGNN